jgi:aminoglycoside 3-N-acetyltransferase
LRGSGVQGSGVQGSGVQGGGVQGSAGGVDRAGLLSQLRQLGVRHGDVLLVQASFSSIGPVAGGVAAVVRALLDAVGEGVGTLVAYTATPENSLTSRAHRQATAGLDAGALARYRAAMPAFDPATTPASPIVGVLAEAIRRTPGALRSGHPQTSFTAIGPCAEKITSGHALASHLGEESPLGRLYELGASALLVGIPSWLLTPYHLADCRAPDAPRFRYSCVVPGEDGRPGWVSFDGVALDDQHFPELGDAVRRVVPFAEGRVGRAESFLVPIVPAVDAATEVLREKAARVQELLR